MIGLVDYDLQTATKVALAPPNLEIMKLAAYYKTEENIFCRLIPLNETELTGYDTIYFFSESNSWPAVPPAFLNPEINVVFGGTAFTNGQYVPFKNSVIDYTLPRPSIYKEFLKEKYADGIKTSVISHILDDSYYRMYAGEKKLPIPPIKKNKHLYLYDRDFFYPDWKKTIEQIIARDPSNIIRIHPIVCNTLSQFFSLREFTRMSRTCDIILDINIPLEDVNYMLRKYTNLFLAEITASSNVCLPIGGSFISAFQYYKDLIYKLNLLYSFWSKGIMMKLKYIAPKSGITNPLHELELLITQWSRGKTKFEKTILQKIRKPKTKKDIVIEEEQKELLLRYHPTAKDLFEQSYNKLSNGGYWRI